MNKLFIAFLLLFIYKLLSNIYYLFVSIYLKNKYQKYISTIAKSEKYNGNMLEKLNEIKSLFKKANINDASIPYVELLGYGKMISTTVSAFDNMFANNIDVYSKIISSFDAAIGEFKHRIFQCINPIHWIETIILLPTKLIEYLGLSSTSIHSKVFNVLWWLFLFLLGMYQDEIKTLLTNYLSNLFK